MYILRLEFLAAEMRNILLHCKNLQITTLDVRKQPEISVPPSSFAGLCSVKCALARSSLVGRQDAPRALRRTPRYGREPAEPADRAAGSLAEDVELRALAHEGATADRAADHVGPDVLAQVARGAPTGAAHREHAGARGQVLLGPGGRREF